jgi:hypothetical protein
MTSPQAESPAQALGESLAALAAQVAALRGQVTLVNQRLDRAGLRGDLDLAARFEELARTVADARTPPHPAAPRPRRPLLDRPGPPGLHRAARRAKAMGRHRPAPALPRLRSPGPLAQPHPRRLGTIHPGRRMAPHLWRQTPRPGPRPGVLRPLAPQHHAPHRLHHPDMHGGMRHAPPPLVTGPGALRAPYLLGEPLPCRGGEPEHGAGSVFGVADGDQVLVLAEFDALATVSTGVA